MEKDISGFMHDIDDVIKKLQRAKKLGKTSISSRELIKMVIPKVNTIDWYISTIEKAIKPTSDNRLTELEAERATGIQRMTFYRWRKKGIVGESWVNLIDVLEKLKYIKSIVKE